MLESSEPILKLQSILALIIPVLNEQDNILSLFKNISKRISIPITIYVIYDYDEDPTLDVINTNPSILNCDIVLLKNKYAFGALNAIKTGFEGFKEEACVVIMADGSDDLRSINGMYGLFCQGFHIVQGSRYMRNGGQIGGSFIKKTLSRLVGASLYLLTKLPVHDVTNNFKLYTRKALSMVTIESKAGFEIGMEVIVKSHILGLSITEVPTVWTDRFIGESKFKIWKWIPSYLKWYFYLLIRNPFFIRKKQPIYNTIRQVGA